MRSFRVTVRSWLTKESIWSFFLIVCFIWSLVLIKNLKQQMSIFLLLDIKNIFSTSFTSSFLLFFFFFFALILCPPLAPLLCPFSSARAADEKTPWRTSDAESTRLTRCNSRPSPNTTGHPTEPLGKWKPDWTAEGSASGKVALVFLDSYGCGVLGRPKSDQLKSRYCIQKHKTTVWTDLTSVSHGYCFRPYRDFWVLDAVIQCNIQ